MDTRNLIVGLCLAVGVYMLYALVIWPRIAPVVAPPARPAQPSETWQPDPPVRPAPSTEPAQSPETRPAAASARFESSVSSAPVQLGSADQELLMQLTPRGGAIETIELTTRKKDGTLAYRSAPRVDQPVLLVGPAADELQVYNSFETARLWIKEYGPATGFVLSDVLWETIEATPFQTVFRTVLRDELDAPLLELRKTYTLIAGKPVFTLTVAMKNLSSGPLTVQLQQNGALGIHCEHQQSDMRYLMAATRVDGALTLSRVFRWADLQKATLAGAPTRLFESDASKQRSFAWAALGSKFFAVFVRPLGDNTGLRAVTARVAAPHVQQRPGDRTIHGDLLVNFFTQERVLAAGTAAEYPFEVYAGPKDADVLDQVNPAYVDANLLGYHLFHGADLRCFCTPLWLTNIMARMLHGMQWLLGNGGLAIIALVIVVRTILHPLSVFQQKTMFRSQEKMVKIQPRIAEIKKRHPGDAVKQNQEMMKLWAEEGFNPLSSFVGFLPMLLQIPILGALWTALNTDIYLRHAPLDGFWIRDLSAPDSLIKFGQPIDIPILSWLPFIGWYFKGITSFNLLPVLMGISMYLQQKYMPKPHLDAKLKAAREQQTQAAGPGGMTVEDQIRQQQMVANMMSIMFPFMFYLMPSGLNLYWMATNVFGIGESLLIRRQIDREKAERERLGPKAARPPGPISRWIKNMAARFEDLQKKADELAERERRRPPANGRERNRKRS